MGKFLCFNSSLDNLLSDSELTLYHLLSISFIVQPVVPALFTLGGGVGDVLPRVLPPHLVVALLHLPEKLSFRPVLTHTQVDGVDEPELPALTADSGAVLAGTHLLFLGVLLGRLQHCQAVGGADLVADLPLALEVSGVLVELAACGAAHAVDDEVAVEMVGVHMGGDHHLEVREQPLGQLQPDGVNFLRGSRSPRG